MLKKKFLLDFVPWQLRPQLIFSCHVMQQTTEWNNEKEVQSVSSAGPKLWSYCHIKASKSQVDRSKNTTGRPETLTQSQCEHEPGGVSPKPCQVCSCSGPEKTWPHWGKWETHGKQQEKDFLLYQTGGLSSNLRTAIKSDVGLLLNPE